MVVSMNSYRPAQILCLFGMALGSSLPGIARADESLSWSSLSLDERQQVVKEMDIEQTRDFGLQRFQPDTHKQIVGWRLTDRWYLGRQQSRDRGVTLVWQASTNQVSLSQEGVRLTRRF